MSVDVNTIETLLDERRTFSPAQEFRRRARVIDDSLHRAAEADPETFRAEQANTTTTLADAHIVSDLQQRAKEEHDTED